ncbi:MAG: PAS domain S-box protein [Dehalococcoidia bacterium]
MKEKGRRVSATSVSRKEDIKLSKILIVDDSEENLRLFSAVLTNKGYSVTTAGNGEEALRKLRRAPPDLILSDILMPVMDGFRLLQVCKADPALSNIRFVCLTGAFTDPKDEELGLKLGADAFLRKPIEPDDLARALADVFSAKPAAKKRGRKPQAGKDNAQAGLYNAALMQKLEQKMEALEEELSERKKAEEELAESEEQYRLLFETMDQGVMYWAGGRVISFNPAAARILGMEPDNLLGRATADPIWKGCHEDGSEFAADDFPVTVAFKTGKPARDVTMGFFSPADGRFHWIRVNAIPQFRPAEDRPYRVYSTFDDITDRFFAFKALQESDSRMSAILENTRDVIWSVDRDYSLTMANDNARRLYNQIYGATLIEGMDVRSAIAQENRDFWSGVGQRVFNGEQVSFERHLEFADVPIDLEFSLSPIISASGRITGASCFARDITQRKSAEQSLRKSEELFRKAVQSTTDIVWEWDMASNNLKWYGDIDALLGYSAGEFPRTLEAWEKALHPDDHGRVITALNRHTETGEPYNVEYRIMRKDGALRNWIDRGLVIYDENGKITRSVGACVDITEHRQIEARTKIRRDLAWKLAGRIHMQTALKHCLNAAIEISGFDTGVIYILDGKSGDFKAACSHGGSAFLLEHYSVLKADSADARLIKKGLPLYAKAAEFTPPFDKQLKPEGFTFDATIPVVYQGDVIASLGVFSHTQNDLTPTIRDSLEEIAADIGVIIDRISYRQALQVSEEKYRLVVENARESILVAQDGMMKFANQNTARMTGYPEEELSSLPFVNLIHPDDRELVVDRHLRRLKGEVFEEVYPFRVVRSDGQFRWVEIQAILIEWEGRPATLNFLTDITGRRQSEQRSRIRRDLAMSLIGITDLETASSLCLDAAIDMAGFDSGVVYILDEESGDFRAVHYRGVSPAIVDNLSVLPAGSKWARLILKGRAFYVKAEEFTPPFDEQLRPEGFSFHATIPIQHGNRVIASLGVYSHVETDMPDVVRNSLEAIAADIGIVIERIQSRRELQRSQERYDVIAENTSDVIWIMDKFLRYTHFSPSVMKQRGYSPEEILQLKLEQVVAPSSIQQVTDVVAGAIVKLEGQPGMGPVTHTGEMEVFRKDGSTIWTETSFTVTADERGKFSRLFGISRDITERRQAEQALKLSEQHYRSLFHQNPAITYALDLQGHFTSINASAVRITGYSEEEALRLDFIQGIAPEYLETVKNNYARALKGEPQSYEAAIIAKDGRRIDVHITGIPIIIDGKVTGVYGIAEDITGRKKADEDLKAALENASSILEGTIEAIVLMSELRDPYTSGHQRMVSRLAVAMATEIGMETDRVQDLAVAGLLHDVGKVYVPSEILSKPGKLSSLELSLAKAHAEASYNIVRSIKFSGSIAHIVWQHHERMDGSGYPQGLNGDQIMLEARILAVADVVEAMTSHRPYRPALGLEKALAEITSNRATLYDAQAVDACLALFNEKGFQFQD